MVCNLGKGKEGLFISGVEYICIRKNELKVTAETTVLSS